MQTLNLCIECLDRPGLLAEIAQTIASYGHNIKVCLLSSLLPHQLYPEHACESLPSWHFSQALGSLPPLRCVSMGLRGCCSSKENCSRALSTCACNHPGCMSRVLHSALDGKRVALELKGEA